MSDYSIIKSCLPQAEPFLFVDEFIKIDEQGALGHYTFREDEYFYRGHFPSHPITPGVILIEVMAQIGLMGLGIFLTKPYEQELPFGVAFTSSQVDFLKPVYPGQQVWVQSEKIYFRFRKLKCKVQMKDENNEILCQGELSGMILSRD